jgi:SAM-dependent methyltransferase
MPFKDERFDLIHCSHLVEHLVPQDLYGLLCEVDRVLKRGGVFVISAPLLWHGFYDDLSHIRPYPPSVFRKYMCASGARNTTRRAIPGEYVVENLQYRYTRRPPAYFDVSTSRRWAKTILFRMTNFLRRISFARYEVSGFTLVLRKNAGAKMGDVTGETP